MIILGLAEWIKTMNQPTVTLFDDLFLKTYKWWERKFVHNLR